MLYMNIFPLGFNLPSTKTDFRRNGKMNLPQFILSLIITLPVVASYRDLNGSFVSNNTIKSVKQELPDLKHCDFLQQCYCRDESVYTNGSYHLLVNCTNSGLDEIPRNIPVNTTVLTLNGNHIRDLHSEAFKQLKKLKYLDLSGNNITEIYNDSFEGLDNLKTLELSQNKIRYNNKSIPNAVFKPLKNLKRLNLHQNFSFDDVEDDEHYPTEALSGLNGLEELLLDGLKDRPFPKDFSKMKRLQSFELNGNNGRCDINHVSLGMFKFCRHITSLKLIKCNIHSVELGSFIELQNLQYLDISYNEDLSFRSLPNITFGLQNQKLTTVRLIKINRGQGVCVTLGVEHVIFMKNMTIDNLFLDSNRLASLTTEAVDYIPKNIKGLSLKDNMIIAGAYLIKILRSSLFSHLIYINLSEQNINTAFIDAFRNNSVLSIDKHEPEATKGMSKSFKDTAQKTQMKLNEVQLSCTNCKSVILPFRLSEKLKDIDLSDMRIRMELIAICICEPNSLVRLNLERNIFWSWQGTFKGLTRLLNLNLAWNSCEKMSKDVFHDMTALMNLNLSRNFLDNILRNDPEGEIFKNQTNLQTLDLSDNKLRSLPPKIFKGLKSLTRLFLANNFLTVFDIDLSHMSDLFYLCLSNNLLLKLPQGTMETFEAKGMDTFINLSNNNLTCDCNDLDFVESFSKTKTQFVNIKDYRCKYENGSYLKLSNADSIYSQLQTDCADYTLVILVSSVSLFVFLIGFTTAIIYRYRWDLRYFYYSAKLRYQGYMPIASDEDDARFEHDVFVSYCDANGRFVKDVLVPELEDKRGVNVLVHDRDFIAGRFVSDNIVRAVTNSRKTLIIMSRDFLKSKWCVFEMNMARMEAIKTGRNILCVIMLEPVQTSGLPLEIMDIIRRQTYLERPENRDYENLFWDRVHDALIN